jgi:hypothetical protein
LIFKKKKERETNWCLFLRPAIVCVRARERDRQREKRERERERER